MLLPAILLLNLIIGLHIIKTITDHLLVNKIKNLPPAPFPPLPVVGHLHLFKIPLFRNLSKLSAPYGPAILLKIGLSPCPHRVIPIGSRKMLHQKRHRLRQPPSPPLWKTLGLQLHQPRVVFIRRPLENPQENLLRRDAIHQPSPNALLHT